MSPWRARIKTATVSDTHLDVYKRQVYVRYFVSRITLGGVFLIQKEKSSKKKLLKKLSPFYIIAALCIVSALGVSLWSAKFRVKTDNGESTRKDVYKRQE